MKKKLIWILSLLFVLAPFFSGCGIFHPPLKDENGYYPVHFNCCGPTAVEKAINEYYRQQGIVFVKNPAPREEVSKLIQDDGMVLKRFISFFHKQIVCASWSWELKSVVKKYGFELVNINSLENLDPIKDIALVIVRGKFFSKDWHWMCYPVDGDINSFFGPDTKIDKILLLKKIN